MSYTFLWWLVPVCLFGAFVLSMFVVWITMSLGNFPHRVKPGDTYEVQGRTYRVPRLPHKVYRSKRAPSVNRAVPMLDKTLLGDLRTLIIDSFDTLREAEVDFWVTGGTLISALLWQQLMCYDDDCDIAVDWEDREYLWSPEFSALLARKGLETFFLRGATLRLATREGAAVRIRRRGTTVPTLDIFFVKALEDGRYGKVNSWLGDSVVFNDPKEVWESKDWIFPTRDVVVDDMLWSLPNQGELCLERQYGPDWNKYLKSPEPLTNSHKFAFAISNWFQAWRVGDVSTETDLEKLKNPRQRLELSNATHG